MPPCVRMAVPRKYHGMVGATTPFCHAPAVSQTGGWGWVRPEQKIACCETVLACMNALSCSLHLGRVKYTFRDIPMCAASRMGCSKQCQIGRAHAFNNISEG